MIPIPSNLAMKLVAGTVAALLLALLIHDRNSWKDTATLRQEQLVAERNAHKGTVANYRAAAERARRDDAENLARVKASQAAINERTVDEFENRIAVARARAGELRQQAGRAAADSRSGGSPPVRAIPASAQGSPEAAGQDRLPDSDALIATEQAIQLDELIKWVRRQAEVEPGS